MTKYNIKEINDKVIKVVFEGDITLDYSMNFKDEIKKYLLENKIMYLVIDLSGVSFIDSSGLGMLISFFKDMNEKQGQIVYIGIHDYVKKLIELVQLSQVFIVKETEDEALEVLKTYYE